MKAFACCFLMIASAGCVPSVPAHRTSPPAPVEGTAELAREVLVQHCGRCHRSDLPTAVPGALAVFDLTQNPWFLSLSDAQLDSMVQRVRSSRDVAAADLEAIEAFATRARSEGSSGAP